MKTFPTLLLALLAAPAAFAGTADRNGDGFVDPREALLAGGHAVRSGLETAWNKLETAGMVLSEDLADAADAIEQGARDVRHSRPDLPGEYLKIVKKGDKVVLVYCDSRIRNIGRLVGRRGRQSCEKLHENQSFKASELDRCLDTLKVEDKGPGLNIRVNLPKAAASEYGHEKFRLAYPVSSFKGYLAACQEDIVARNAKRPGAARPVAGRELPAAPSEFKPFEPARVEAPRAGDQGDTL